jgi:cell volume regulation protein A
MADILTVFSTTGAILAIGFLGNLIFKKTGFPAILFLLLIGLILGPLLNVFPRESLLPVVPFISALTLIIILFDSGLHMNIYKVLSQSVRSTILAILYVMLATISTALIAHFLMNLRWLEALMLGPMIAGTSSVVIIPLMFKLKINHQIDITLSLESTITDVLNVVLLLTILEIYLTGFLDIQGAISTIASRFAVGIVIGAAIGVTWIQILYLIKREEYTYMLTIAILLLLYVATEMLGGNGALAALVFGLMLGNDREIIHILRIKIKRGALKHVKSFLRKFHSEISFLVRSFFFVFLGLIYDISGASILPKIPIVSTIPVLAGIFYGFLFTAINLVLRYIAVSVATIKSSMAIYKKLMTLMCGQGLANATVSVIVYQSLIEKGMLYASLYPIIVVNVIIITNVITSLSVVLLGAKAK